MVSSGDPSQTLILNVKSTERELKEKYWMRNCQTKKNKLKCSIRPGEHFNVKLS